METAQELIRHIKEAKARARGKITYDDIIDELTVNGSPRVSKTTIRRVFANGSEDRASSFNYEETLLPIYNALRELSGIDDSPQAKEILHFMEQIALKDKQIEEMNKMIARLMNRLDRKDDIIEQFITDLRQKDEIIKRLMEGI